MIDKDFWSEKSRFQKSFFFVREKKNFFFATENIFFIFLLLSKEDLVLTFLQISCKLVDESVVLIFLVQKKRE